MRRLLALILFLPLCALAQQRAFDVDDLVRLDRASDPQLSADGKRLVYTLRQTDWDHNKAEQSLWQLRLDQRGAQPRRLTAKGASASHPRLSGERLYFLSARGGSNQLWLLDGPGEARQASSLPLDVGGFLLAPDGRSAVVALEIHPDCGADLACSKTRAEEAKQRKSTGTLHDRLYIRHWDTWKTGTRSQLFLLTFDEQGVATAEPRWLTRGIDGDVPVKPFGDLGDAAFAPDSSALVFVARLATREEAWSTNSDVYRVALSGEGDPENLTVDYPGYDTSPVISRDGRKLYWLSMERPGYEADRNRILEMDLASRKVREIAANWDRSANHLVLSADGRSLLSNADDLGQRPLFVIDIASGQVRAISGAGSVGGFAVGRERAYFLRDDLGGPADLYSAPLAGGPVERLTRLNAGHLAEVAFGAYEQFDFPGWNDEKVYGWVVKPHGFEPGQRYPVAFIVHGGPQGSMGNSFHYRWNPQTYAGKGFAVVFIDFHGSTGYGQAFTDSIRGDWGGKPLVDLQKGWAAAQQRFDFLDGECACALGASYGGYMMNWIAGAWSEAFSCIVSHAGIFDNRFMAYTTEELFFDEWEFEGTHYEHPENYERHNPVNLVANWKSPMLVIHGMLDFRVPFEQGIAAFTALQRRGVPSEFLWFPDENHWILKPHNSVLWHRTVESWLTRWTARPGS